MFHNAMRAVITGKRGRSDENERDQHPRPERLHDNQQELPDAERERRADEPDEDGAEPTRARVISPQTEADAGENGNTNTASVNSSQQKKPMAAMDRIMPRMIMVAPSESNALTVAPSTTTTARR